MELCARCHKRVAVVFITKMENNNVVNEGICLKCAHELGLKPVDEIMKKMGISEEDLDNVEQEMGAIMENADDSDTGEQEEGKTPTFDLKKVFGALQFNGNKQQENNKSEKKEQKVKPEKETSYRYLNTYCVNLNQKAADGKIDDLIGRERELTRVMQILCRRQKNNPCLIGEPGVGKTAIAEALAVKIQQGTVPFKLKNKTVYLLDLTSLVAGTQFRGQFEQRLKGLIDDVIKNGNAILVIDEVHNIVGAGESEGSLNAANILKPALSRGEIQVIGATTLTEYRKHIEKDAALERRFQPVIVEESNIEDTVKILKGIKKYYEEFHGVCIPDDIISKAVILSERYITDRFLPDKAIDLLDEAASNLVLTSKVINEYLTVKNRLDINTANREKAENELASLDPAGQADKYKEIADLRTEQFNLEKQCEELEKKRKKVKMTVPDLAKIIEVWTGIPASNISLVEFEKLSGLEERLKKRIVGQDKAIDAIVRAIKRNRTGISPKKKPVSFIFAGPTGVGKTELVKTLAADLFDSPETVIRLDMSEFMEKHSVSKIIGAPPGYVGYDDAGQLTEKIRRKPYSVVLFDEIEKAHPDVLNILLQILDDGVITDAQGRKVNFENAIVIMTTNAGSDLNLTSAGFNVSEQAVGEERTQKALFTFLKPEFINRVDEVITFRSLEKEDFRFIVDIMLGDLKKSLDEKGINLIYSDAAACYIADKSFSRKFGARNMRRFIQRNIEDVVADYIVNDVDMKIGEINIDYKPGNEKLNVECK